MKHLCLLLLALPLAGCSSAPKRISITARPVRAVVVVLDDPAASAFLVAQESEKMVKKILKCLSKDVDSKLMNTLEQYSLDELIARVVAWLHIDRIPPDAVQEINAVFGKLPGAVREELLGMIGVDDFDVTPMEMKRGHHKTYAIIAWAPGYKAKLKTLNPVRTPDDLNFTLDPK